MGRKLLQFGDIVRIKGEVEEYTIGVADLIYPLYNQDGTFNCIKGHRKLKFVRKGEIVENSDLSTMLVEDESNEDTPQE